jgi:hypothetical protein
MNKAAINAPEFKPTSFKPVDQIKSFVPTNKSSDNEEEQTKDGSNKKVRSLFDFPDGGWECSKC